MNKERFTETVVNFAQIDDKTRIAFPDARQLTMASIVRGILFIFAGWSGPSVHAWKALTRALRESGSDFKFYVLDADELPEQFADAELKSIPQGNGETFWVRNGKILHSLIKYDDKAANQIRMFTEETFNN